MSVHTRIWKDPVTNREILLRMENCELCEQELPADNGDYWRLLQPGLPDDTTCFQVCVNCFNKNNKERPKP